MGRYDVNQNALFHTFLEKISITLHMLCPAFRNWVLCNYFEAEYEKPSLGFCHNPPMVTRSIQERGEKRKEARDEESAALASESTG